MKTLYLFVCFASIFLHQKAMPTLYIIGDSTVKAGQGKGENDMWGWGSQIDLLFNTKKIKIENHAIGGRSSRTFLTDGRWEPLLDKMKKGDFLLIQFGHNDDWAINDTIRARGTIKGIGEESSEIDNMLTGKHEIVHSYGWYVRKYVNEAKAKGLEVFICSPVPRNNFDDNGKIKRIEDYYPKWANQVSLQSGAFFIDLHELSSLKYEKLGPAVVKEMYFTSKDNTHTNLAGAQLNAQMVAEAIKAIKTSRLMKYVVK